MLQTTHTYDGANRNTLVELPGGGVVTYLYNGDDRRVAGVDSSGVVTEVLLEQWDSDPLASGQERHTFRRIRG